MIAYLRELRGIAKALHRAWLGGSRVRPYPLPPAPAADSDTTRRAA